MIGLITIRERGATPGILKREFNRASKEAWREAAIQHHVKNTSKRFTAAHAREAKYTKRKGEMLPPGSKAFKRSYHGSKLASPKRGGGAGQANPLVNTGVSQKLSRFPSVTSTSSRARLRHKTPAFNFRHPKSRVRMSDEFRRILPAEKADIAGNYDNGLDDKLNSIRATKTTTL